MNNAVTSMRLLQLASTKCPHFACHFTRLVPHSPRLVPKACLSCLRQLETLVVIPCITGVVSKLIAIVGTETMLLNQMTEHGAKAGLKYDTVEDVIMHQSSMIYCIICIIVYIIYYA